MDAANITQVAMLLRVLIIMVLVIMGRERERYWLFRLIVMVA